MPEENDTQPVKIESEEGALVRELEESKRANLKEVLLPAGVILAIIVAGVVTGYFLSSRRGIIGGPAVTKTLEEGVEVISGPREVGIKDVRVFRDTTQGKLEINEGTITREGSHRLLRPGGESQTAYLTSSVVDLNLFVGKCVQVWGETFKGEKAAWLMDVGRVKLLDKCPSGV